jgi:hypothetical protein
MSMPGEVRLCGQGCGDDLRRLLWVIGLILRPELGNAAVILQFFLEALSALILGRRSRWLGDDQHLPFVAQQLCQLDGSHLAARDAIGDDPARDGPGRNPKP